MTTTMTYRPSHPRSACIHRCTSVISLLGSVVSPERLPPQMLRRRTIAAVKIVIYVSTQISAHLPNAVMADDAPGPAVLQ